MRIAYLSTQTGFYGGEVHLCHLAAGMRDRGHRIACVVRPGSRLAARLDDLGITYHELPLVDWYEPVTMLRLHGWLRRSGAQVLHTHTPRDHYIAAVATVGTGIRNVGTRHQLHPIALPGLKRPLLGRLDALIAVSDAVHAVLRESPLALPPLTLTIHNGVDTGAVLPERDGLRRAVGLTPDAPVVGFVGRLSPDKGVETLLEAAARLAHGAWPRLRVFIVGDDPRGGHVRHLHRRVTELDLQDAVHFFGYVPRADRASADFDVQVVTSHAEPFGLVTLEAMAHRHAVVATTTGGSPEIVRDGVEGFLVPPRRPALLAERLDRLLREPDLRRRLGECGRRRVEERFSLARMLDATEEVYRRVLAESRVDSAAESAAGSSAASAMSAAAAHRAPFASAGHVRAQDRPGAVDEQLHGDHRHQQSHELLDDAQAGLPEAP
jgi:glycosyltransferase involved in cell wall biosynthesis